MKDIKQRIDEKTDRIPFSDCIIWTGASSGRYGSILFNGKIRPVHRVVLEISGVQIPKGFEVLHSCDVGLCINKLHLSVGTHAENMSDMKKKGRQKSIKGENHWTRKNKELAVLIAKTNIKKAHKSGFENSYAKVTKEILVNLRADYESNKNQTLTDLGLKFKIGKETTRKILKRIPPWNI